MTSVQHAITTQGALRVLILTLIMLTTGCALGGDYFGGYDVRCQSLNVDARREEVGRIAQYVSSELGRPLQGISSGIGRENDLILAITFPPSPSVVFSFYADSEPRDLWISVAKSGHDEDESVRNVRNVIEKTLKNSICSQWRYGVSHFSPA